MSDEIVFCKGGGCTAKLGAGALSSVLSKLQKNFDPNLLVGFDSSDDGAVYKLTDDLAIVQTLDFFPPMVDDPYIFGQVAAANALSDIYAMGGEVKTALNIVCFPEKMDLNILGKILQGGNEKVQEAGGVLVGGHSIVDVDVKYGLSVMGIVHPDKIYKNDSPRSEDVLILTKPLGVGIICTAERVGECSQVAMDIAVKSMTTLNKYAMEVFKKYNVNACTDVTGFGLLGHLKEMLGEEFGAEVYTSELPVIEEALEYADEFYITAAAQKNRNHCEGRVLFKDVSFAYEEVLFDPQTSGGLLVSLPENEAEKAIKEIAKLGLPCGIIGKVTKGKENIIIVKQVKE